MKVKTGVLRRVLALGLPVLSLALGGCLGSGSSDSSTATTTTPTTTETAATTLSGVAGAGPINGQACAYSVGADGSVGSTALGCAATNAATGAYSISFSGYAGNVLVKAFGTYTDEATGQSRTIAEANALRALVSCATAGSACQAAVTPLTEAALRGAETLTAANVEAAYLRVAQAYGLNPSNAADAVAKLVGTIPNFSARTDAAAARYADVLAIASQAQATYCGAASSCTLDSYLAAIRSVLGASSGVTNIQSAVGAAISAWNANPRNTAAMTCTFSASVLTCTLPASSSTGGGASGNYRLTITVTANGIATPAIVINNIPRPSGSSEFCGDATVTQQLNTALNGVGTWTINSCSFSGNSGTISATVTITTPINFTLPYTISYQYAAL